MNWLCNKVKLANWKQCYDAFINAGIDNLSMIKMINIEQLIEIGINDMYDQTRILIEIAILNETEL